MLNDEELVERIGKRYRDFRITVSDIKNPTAKFLQQYFLIFFEEFGADVSALMQPSPEQLQDFEYPQAFKAVLPLSNYFFAVKFLLQHIKSDFKISFTDLTEPSTGKTKVLMLIMEEFYNYANCKAVQIISLEQAVLQKRESFNLLLHEIQVAKETINKRANELAQMQLHRQELAEAAAAQEIKITELQLQLLKLDEENKEMEEELIKCKATFDEVEKEKKQLEETLKDLESKVAELPTDAMLAAAAEKRMKMKEEFAFTVKKLEERNGQIIKAEKNIKHWEDICSKLEEVVTFSKELQSKKAILEALQREQASEADKQEANKEKCRKLHAKITQQADKRAAQKVQWLETKASLEKKIEEEKRKNELLRKEKEEELKEAAQIEKLIVKKDEELFMLQDENNRMCRIYDEKYMKMVMEQDDILFRITGKHLQ